MFQNHLYDLPDILSWFVCPRLPLDQNSIRRKAMSRARSISVVLALFVLFACGAARAQDSPRIGVKIRTLTLELRKQHKLGDVKGALVTAVTAGSPAKEQGIVVGDVIVEAGAKPVASAKDVASQIAAATAAGNDKIALRILNAKGERREVTVGLEKRPAEGSKSLVPGPK
jgi:S1-C subfamily serine protease